MNVRAYVFGIAAALFVLVMVIYLLRRRRLRERHAVWWMFAGLLALIVGVFPDSLEHAARAVGIELPINLVFFVSITLLFLVSLQHSAELTKLESRTRDLAETIALLELKVRDLTEQRAEESSEDEQSEPDETLGTDDGTGR